MKKLIPLRGYCLIKLLDTEETTTSGLVLPDNAQVKQAKGKILTLGLQAYDHGNYISIEVNEGDVIWFKRFAGEEITENGEKFMLVPYDALIAISK